MFVSDNNVDILYKYFQRKLCFFCQHCAWGGSRKKKTTSIHLNKRIISDLILLIRYLILLDIIDKTFPNTAVPTSILNALTNTTKHYLFDKVILFWNMRGVSNSLCPIYSDNIRRIKFSVVCDQIEFTHNLYDIYRLLNIGFYLDSIFFRLPDKDLT